MRRYINDSFPHFIHGCDYNPEQWIDTKEIWDEDMRLMKQANINEFTMGMFSWATLEPEEGKYDFSFLDEMLDKIHANGGKVVLSTPSGARPRWLANNYPEVLRVKSSMAHDGFGWRHNHCYTSPVYREKVRNINMRLAQRYGKHPAVIAWHISNEYSGKCFCPNCEAAFREFIRNKYDNDVKKLNTAYWATFWSQQYASFDEVKLPRDDAEGSIHGLNIDHKRFISHQTIDFMKNEIAAIRTACPDLPVTTNMMPGLYDIDYYEMAKYLDVISWDSYPEWHKKDSTAHYETAFWHDFFRSLKDRPFMLMESAPGLVNWQDYNKLKRPGVDKMQALQAVAHGSDTVQYFQWRKGKGGVEKFHGAVVDHVGTSDTRIFKTIQSIGETLQKIDEVCGSGVKAKVAIIFDWNNRWAVDESCSFALHNKKYVPTCVDYYKTLWEKGIAVDIISAHGDFSKYQLVIAPMLYLTDRETIQNLTAFVENGGVLYGTYMLGMVNETDLCYAGGFPAENLKDVFGIWNEEIDTLYPEERVQIQMQGTEYVGKEYCELIHSNGAQILAEYGSEFYAKMPAMTVNSYGKGKAYYQAFRHEGDFFGNILAEILQETGIQSALPGDIPEGVSAHIREDGDVKYLFVENYSAVSTPEIVLGGWYTELETGKQLDRLTLEGYEVKILKQA